MKERGGDYNHYGKSIGESLKVGLKVNGIIFHGIYKATKEPIKRRVNDHLHERSRKRAALRKISKL